MKKLILAFVLLMLGYVSHAQISMPSTYKYTKKGNPYVFGEHHNKVREIPHYFIFRSADEVIWAIESIDGYIYPIAFGTYDASNSQIVFTKQHSYCCLFNEWNVQKYKSDKVVFNVSMSNGVLKIAPLRDDLKDLFADGMWTTLTKCDYTLNPSNSLVGTYWVGTNEKFHLYFKSTTEVLINGKSNGYMLIGNAIAMLGDDNPFGDECVVGIWYGGKTFRIHRSGVEERKIHPAIDMKKVN